MKFSKNLFFLIIHIFLFIKASDIQNITKPELSVQRRLQSNNSENIYDLYITGYSLYMNYLNLFFYFEPELPDELDINLILRINITKYKYSEIYSTKEFELDAFMVNINKSTAVLDKEELVYADGNSNFLFITIKNISIESFDTNDNNIYNIHLIEISFNIIPFNFEIKEEFDGNSTKIEEKTTNLPEYSPSNINLNKIHIIGYDLIENTLNLYTYFENVTNDDIYFLIKLNKDSFNIIGNYWQREEINIKTIDNIEKNKYTAIFNNLNINEVETNTKITIIEINAYPNQGNALYNVDNSQITFDIKPSRKLELDKINLANINQNIYNIYFTEIFPYNNEIHLLTYSEPEIFSDMHYLVSFNLDKFNSSELYWQRKKNSLNTTNNINGTNEFILNLDDFNLDNFPSTVTITNIKEEQSDENNIYYIHFPIKSFNIENQIKSSIIKTTIFLDTDIPTESDSFTIISPNKKISSSKISTGALVGLILGIIVVLSGITFLIIKCFCKNEKIADFPPPIHISINSSTDLINVNDDINLRCFNIQIQAQNQIENIIKIEKNKTMKDLRKQFFENINRIDLFEDIDIYFLCNGRPFTIESNEIIENIFKNYTQCYGIIVVDDKDKISKTIPKADNKINISYK